MSAVDNKMDFDRFLKNFKKHISNLKLKNSLQKDYILKALYFEDEHLNAEEITAKVKNDYNIDIGIATVYRALKFFEDINIITSLDIGDGAKKYELNLSTHHDHMICTNCHKIIEFNDDFIEDSQVRIAKENGFLLKDHTMIIYGICEECQ
ncbi:ferric uptake regulation protein [Malaciobacter pacificus]|jgi:Fur family ferric uptake transcriptional regulator|uniref:Transcriptional regulator, Fur family n=1 Tax=Malaciobacter pacificus TaxID=1080223 RepID=A0A5C2H670_9BACT|nr:transcriptional repressor [Malaciobacter pacificus]QEP34461.1 transcriptional regulator, Fur family [Malaciobacter pacificus]GGD34363.1 ferric uptake regulation protein [Malaciobacter pacificus]